MKQTIIKWQTVNTRKKNKNLPKPNRVIVFKLQLSDEYKEAFQKAKEGIATSGVHEENGNLYVLRGLQKIPFSNGFMWCYLDDTEDVED